MTPEKSPFDVKYHFTEKELNDAFISKAEVEKIIDEPLDFDNIIFQGKRLSHNKKIELAMFLLMYKKELKKRLRI